MKPKYKPFPMYTWSPDGIRYGWEFIWPDQMNDLIRGLLLYKSRHQA